MAERECWSLGLVALLPLAVTGCGGRSLHEPAGVLGDSGAMGTTTGAADAGLPKTLILEAHGGPSGAVSAAIQDTQPGVGLLETCDTPRNDGACQLTSCSSRGIGSAGRGYGNFGSISASVGATTVLLTYGGSGYGTVYFPSSVTLGTGDSMRFRGGGSVGVPVFDVSATIPGLAVITSPVATSGGAATVINTSEDLSVTWLPIAIGQIHFVLHAGDDLRGPSEATVACTFEGASGAGAVPHALLSSVREMFPAGPSYVVLSSESDASTTIDGLAITTWSFQSSPTEDLVFNVALQ